MDVIFILFSSNDQSPESVHTRMYPFKNPSFTLYFAIPAWLFIQPWNVYYVSIQKSQSSSENKKLWDIFFLVDTLLELDLLGKVSKYLDY